jgi:hypothetical protein
LARAINRAVALLMGRALAVRNLEGEPLGVVNRLLYRLLNWTIAISVIYLLIER